MSRVGLGQGIVMPRRAVLALAPGLVALGASRALAQRRPAPPASPAFLVRADRVID